MPAISESIVREYFELHEFLVRQYRKHVAPGEKEDDDIDFFVSNPQPQAASGEIPFALQSTDLAFIERAVVVIRPWHRQVFTPAVLNYNPELFRSLGNRSFLQAVRRFGNARPPLTLMVVPALPEDRTARNESIAILRSKGIDAVISFRTMLADLVAGVNPNRNYQKSDLLQTLRILKSYDFFREPQLELFKPKRRKAAV